MMKQKAAQIFTVGFCSFGSIVFTKKQFVLYLMEVLSPNKSNYVSSSHKSLQLKSYLLRKSLQHLSWSFMNVLDKNALSL